MNTNSHFTVGLCSLVSVAIFVDYVQNHLNFSNGTYVTDVEYGYSFALFVVGWIMCWISFFCYMVWFMLEFMRENRVVRYFLRQPSEGTELVHA